MSSGTDLSTFSMRMRKPRLQGQQSTNVTAAHHLKHTTTATTTTQACHLMTHLFLSSTFSAIAASITGTAQSKQTFNSCAGPHAPGTTSSSAAQIFLREGGGSSDTLTMGKSNKFDYSKRGNSAVKLGQIISRDVRKEAERASKDAERAAGKARKRSTGSNSSGSAPGSRPRDAVSHTIDLQVPNKALGNEGVCAMAEGLQTALSHGSVLLEDMNLSGNKITTVSLARLAPIISLARHDLKTLNLAGNNIRVDSVEDAVRWEEFLQSFKDCLKLRRLDLSGNPLGSRAFEIMAKVHINEPPVNPMPHRGNNSVISLQSELEFVASSKVSSLVDLMSTGAIIKRRAGLRSIPYITLTETGMDDSSALWLSYIVEDHYFPSQLIDGLNATPANSTIATYQQTNSSRGLDWDLGSRDGLSLLQKAEKFREQMMLAEDEVIDFTVEPLDERNQISSSRPGGRRVSRSSLGHRRASMRSIRTADGGEHELSELESARKRLQRSLIERHGASKVELWSAALRLVISSRILMCIGPTSRDKARLYTGPPKFDFTLYTTNVAVDRSAMTSRPATPRRITPKVSLDSDLSSPDTPSRQGTYAATLTTKLGALHCDRDAGPVECTNTPKTPRVLFKSHLKCALNGSGEGYQKVKNPVICDRNPQRFVRWQEERMKKHQEISKPFRNSMTSHPLPVQLVELIAGFTVTEREKQLLTDKQLQEALSWGQRRSNLKTEKSWRTMADSAQTWTLLENIGCLAYNRE